MARCFYYFFMIIVVIRYKPKATARRALTFIVRIFVNDTIAIAVWTSFHVGLEFERSYEAAYVINPILYRPATRSSKGSIRIGLELADSVEVRLLAATSNAPDKGAVIRRRTFCKVTFKS